MEGAVDKLHGLSYLRQIYVDTGFKHCDSRY